MKSADNTIIEERIQDHWEEYVSRGLEARESKDNSQWDLGDLSTTVMSEYGEDTIGKYSYAIGVEKKTLMNYRTVSARFDKQVRHKYPKLSFSHFATLTAVEKPDAWLEKADDEDWSVEHLRKEVTAAYPDTSKSVFKDEPPDVYRCPECGLWRLKDMSSFDICRGHYKLEKGGLKYQ
jgi:hypothetical protein